tara:strand:- start:266 stop:454 length:189 start_codon:yes stop_codon:yes gene_type:complete
MTDQLMILVTALITGAVSAGGASLLTVAGLRVHVEYLKKATEDNDKSITRAHKRIDDIQASP